MEFLSWHYTKGLQLFLDGWRYSFGYINHYFSIPLLLTTLFSPWKKLVDSDNSPGFDLKRSFEQFTFNLISRGIGAVVRIILFLVGLFLMLLIAIAGSVGLIVWFILPPVGLIPYFNRTQELEIYIEELMKSVEASDHKLRLRVIFASDAGKFTLTRLGLTKEELEESAIKETIDLVDLKPKSFEDIISYLIKNQFWLSKFYRQKGLVEDDLIHAARWWDGIKKSKNSREKTYGKSGLGLELLFGYTPTLNKFSTDLSSPSSFSHRLIGREETVKKIERVLTTGANVCLVGEPGIGKKTILLEFAHRATYGQLGPKMAYKRILELDYNFLLSESLDISQKKSGLTQILNEAASAGNIILLIRDIHRLTNIEIEGMDFTDVFESVLANDDMKILTISTPTEYERFIAVNTRLHKYFEKVEATQPTPEEALDIMIESANRWEQKVKITILVASLRKIIEESGRLITEVPFPEKALELLDSTIVYCQQSKSDNLLTPDDVVAVLSEKTGISLARLTKTEMLKLEKMEEIIHERLIGQEEAVSMISKSLRARTLDVSDRNKPIGSFLFLGPTGVGKTETAKILAKVYYGSTDSILRFDMAEYAGSEGLERLIGSVSRNQHGTLTTAIKNKPASLLLLDEIEKAPKDVFNIFLTLLDEGYITDAFGKKISTRHTFVIGTSNAGANLIRELVNSGIRGEELRSKLVEHIQSENIFSPEFLNRFDGVVVYEPLDSHELMKIAGLLFDELAKKLKSKGVRLTATMETIEKIAKEGYDPAFGARPMKRILDLTIGDLISRSILSGNLTDGDNIIISPGEGKDEYVLERVKE